MTDTRNPAADRHTHTHDDADAHRYVLAASEARSSPAVPPYTHTHTHKTLALNQTASLPPEEQCLKKETLNPKPSFFFSEQKVF